MKSFQLFILLFIFISCKKENVYYYSDNKQIKDSTVIRFADEELLKLKINTQEKNLKIYTTLDSTSYKTNLDSIRNKIFEKALTYNFNPEDKKAFDEWFREKIIVVDNHTGKVINFYSSFRNKKYDRDSINFLGLRKWIVLATAVYENPEIENLTTQSGAVIARPISDLKLEKKHINFLSQLNIKLSEKGSFSNYFSLLDAVKIFQTLNYASVKEPIVITEIFNKEKLMYKNKTISRNIFTDSSINHFKQYLFKLDDLKHQKNCIYFGLNSDFYMFINNGNFTYLIYNTAAIITDLKKKEFKFLSPQSIKDIEKRYYNSIRK